MQTSQRATVCTTYATIITQKHASLFKKIETFSKLPSLFLAFFYLLKKNCKFRSALLSLLLLFIHNYLTFTYIGIARMSSMYFISNTQSLAKCRLHGNSVFLYYYHYFKYTRYLFSRQIGAPLSLNNCSASTSLSQKYIHPHFYLPFYL